MSFQSQLITTALNNVIIISSGRARKTRAKEREQALEAEQLHHCCPAVAQKAFLLLLLSLTLRRAELALAPSMGHSALLCKYWSGAWRREVSLVTCWQGRHQTMPESTPQNQESNGLFKKRSWRCAIVHSCWEIDGHIFEGQ